jgi:hypothetical protein
VYSILKSTGLKNYTLTCLSVVIISVVYLNLIVCLIYLLEIASSLQRHFLKEFRHTQQLWNEFYEESKIVANFQTIRFRTDHSA